MVHQLKFVKIKCETITNWSDEVFLKDFFYDHNFWGGKNGQLNLINRSEFLYHLNEKKHLEKKTTIACLET